MGLTNDYRISVIVVLCKDCGEDVGLYPARHVCSNVKKPQLPILCSSTTSPFEDWNHQQEKNTKASEFTPSLRSTESSLIDTEPSDTVADSGVWNFFRSINSYKATSVQVQEKEPESEPESYFDAYASGMKKSSSLGEFDNLLSSSSLQRTKSAVTGRKARYGSGRNDKWKELTIDKQKPTEKANNTWLNMMSYSLESEKEDCPESDEDDWEEETHVSRILREHYQHKNKTNKTPLPSWLYDDRTPISALAQIPDTEEVHQEQMRLRREGTSARRLWDSSKPITARERELQALRATPMYGHDSNNTKPFISRSCSERVSSRSAISDLPERTRVHVQSLNVPSRRTDSLRSKQQHRAENDTVPFPSQFKPTRSSSRYVK